jgi:hypothetical protein
MVFLGKVNQPRTAKLFLLYLEGVLTKMKRKTFS